MDEHTKWSKFVNEISNHITFWCFGIIYFLIFRLIFIIIFVDQINDQPTFFDVYKTFLMGFRFDSTVVSYFILFPFLFTLILAPFNKISIARVTRRIFQTIFIFKFISYLCGDNKLF